MVMRERERRFNHVSQQIPFPSLTKQEPFGKTIQRKINLGKQNSQKKLFLFKMLKSTHWLITRPALSSRHWLTGELYPDSAGQKDTLQPFCPEARMPAPCPSLLIFCTSQRPFRLKPECPFTSSKASSAITTLLFLFFFCCTGLHWDNVKGDEWGLNPRDISVSVWHQSCIRL